MKKNCCASEFWKSIKGFEGRYDVSTCGRVRSYLTPGRWTPEPNKNPQRILLPAKDSDGYLGANLWRKSVGLRVKIHRIVLETFVSPCPEGAEGCHFDANKENNHLENLRWASHRENQVIDGKRTGSFKLGKKGEACHSSKLKNDDIPQIRWLLSLGASHEHIGKLFDVTRTTISKIKRGERWAHI